MIKRKGFVIIIYFYILFIIIMFFIFLSFFDLSFQILRVKKDLFYIVQNSFLALNSQELAYKNIKIDNIILKNRIENLLKFNYPKYKIKIINLYYKDKKIYIELEYEYKPIITLFLKNKNIIIKDKIKLKEMTYE